MKQKIIIMALLIVFTLVLSSCSLPGIGGGDGTTYKDPNKVKLNEFRKGSEGVKIEFYKKLPPDKMYEGDQLKAVMVLQNKGATDISYGKVVLVTTDASIGVTPTVQEYKLKGKNLYLNEGEKTTKEFTIKVDSKGDGRTTFIGYACYPYQTKALDSLCVDPTAGKAVIASKACEMKDITFSGGQGAPVTVKEVEVTPLLRDNQFRLRLNVTIENTEKGKIVSSGIASAECSLRYADDSKINDYLDVDVEVSDGRATCKKYLGDLNKHGKNRGHVICTTGIMNYKYATKVPITVTMNYGYVSKEITKSVSIFE